MKQIVDRFPDETKNYEIKVAVADYAAQTPVATLAQSLAFAAGIQDAPNGLVETGGEPYPHGDITSSNLSFFGFGIGQAENLVSCLGLNTRSFLAQSMVTMQPQL